MQPSALARRAVFLFATILCGLLCLARPALAQKDVGPANVTYVRGLMNENEAPGRDRTFIFTRSGTRWTQRKQDMSPLLELAEESRSNTAVTLRAGERRMTLDLAGKTLSEPAANISGRILEISADTCRWGTSPGGTCICDLRTLRPLQGAVGVGEIAKKRKDIEEDFTKEVADLKKDPIPIVRGPNQDFYVIDHHHGARAWMAADFTHATCKYQEAVATTEPVRFWSEMQARRWVRLADQNGTPIGVDDLPQTLEKIPDDPYRTLAWLLRKADGYCRKLMTPPPPFAEFLWADEMRQRPDQLAPAAVAAATAPDLWQARPGETKRQTKARREAAQAPVLGAALAFARSPAAASLPGYQGTRGLKNEDCNPKGDVE